jgi:hypothetical protein
MLVTREISSALNSAIDEISFLAASCFPVPSPTKDVSHEMSTARGMYLSLWEGAWIGSRETSINNRSLLFPAPVSHFGEFEIALSSRSFYRSFRHCD